MHWFKTLSCCWNVSDTRRHTDDSNLTQNQYKDLLEKCCMLQKKKKKKLHFPLASDLNTNWNSVWKLHGRTRWTGKCRRFTDMCSILKYPNRFFFPNWFRYCRGIWHQTLTCLSSIGLQVGAFSLLIDASIDKRDYKQPLLSFKVLRSREQQLVYANL